MTQSKVFVIGAKNEKADKSISWDPPFPNLSEPDVIIINLMSLTNEVLDRIDKDKLAEAQEVIRDKFFHKGEIVVLSSPYSYVSDQNYIYSNYYLLPVEWNTKNVSEGTRINCNEDNFFKPYIETIKKI